MKALTLTQPWATLIVLKEKRIETRSWGTRYRGPLAIHAAKSFPVGARHFALQSPCVDVLRACFGGTINDWPLDWLRGKVIATCQLVDVVKIEAGTRETLFPMGATCEIPPREGSRELAFGDYTPGRFAWVLDDIKKIDEPLEARGALGLWNWEPAL